MQKFGIFIAAFSILSHAKTQTTGNIIYNSNNRFQNNSSYRTSASGVAYLSSEPTVGMDKKQLTNLWNYGDGSITATDETILNINVLFNAKPTGYMAIFHINQAGKKIIDLDTQVTRRIQKFIRMAAEIGIDKSQFYTDMIALVPIYEQNKKNSNKPRGFELQKNIHVKYKDPEQLDRLFSMAAQCEIYDLIKVEYLYSESEKAGDLLKIKALEILNKKIEHYKKLGIHLDTAQRRAYENGKVILPIDRYTGYTPLAVNSLDDEDKIAEGSEMMKTGTGFIQKTTVFYNGLDGTGFDAVINPGPGEPAIQFTYSLQVRYKMTPQINKITEKQIVKEHEILIVTPSGEVKTIVK